MLTRMMVKDRYLFLAAVALCLFFAVTLTAADQYGKSERNIGPEYAFGSRPMPAVMTGRPEEAYFLWKQNGLRGRIVVSLSRKLNFVPVNAAETPLLSKEPFQITNLAQFAEQKLNGDNFLLVAMEQGIVRQIVHVLPRSDYENKRDYARGRPGITVTQSGISYPHEGSPRILTTLPVLERFREPVLYYINASYFREEDQAEVYAALKKAGIRTDFIVLCRADDDRSVTAEDRRRLLRFAELLTGRDGTR